ncbi:MAG: hypothetical protein WBI17_12375 [Clostridiaceae bacterium]
MRKMALILSILLLTGCSSAPKYEEIGKTKNNDLGVSEKMADSVESAENKLALNIMNFRTSDSVEMKSENRIIKTYEEFKKYNQDYAILDNPFFIDDESLNKLLKVDQEFFEKKGFVAVILVESSGSTQVEGENFVVKDSLIETFISKKDAQMGTSDIATRHVLFEVNMEELEKVFEVKVTFSLK